MTATVLIVLTAVFFAVTILAAGLTWWALDNYLLKRKPELPTTSVRHDPPADMTDDEIRAWAVQRAFKSGNIVVGNRDEHGNLIVQEHKP